MDKSGILRKMRVELANPVQYQLRLDEQLVPLNECIGQSLRLVFSGEIRCTHCGRSTSKSYNQGYCYPCCRDLAQCDLCILKPEQCHYDQGTCREPDWADEHCMQPHYVYLANSSGIKVGITRHTQVPTRWMDQGAVAALPILKVASRFISGLVEVELARHVSDKTSWQKMLKGQLPAVDLIARRDELLLTCQTALECLSDRLGAAAITRLPEAEVVEIHYPVMTYPEKVKSFNFDKTAEVSGVLQGIKGQYLIFDQGVINIRKFSGYQVRLLT